MTLRFRLSGFCQQGLRFIDNLTLPMDSRWGLAARVWGDARWSFLCFVFLLVVFLHPPDGFSFRLCLFHLLYGVDCPGCGMTRGLSHLVHGHLLTALQHHPFSPIVLLYLILQSFSLFLPLEARRKIAVGLSRHGKELGVLFWASVGLFLLHGLGRATVQLVSQGGPFPSGEAPSFRMGW